MTGQIEVTATAVDNRPLTGPNPQGSPCYPGRHEWWSEVVHKADAEF